MPRLNEALHAAQLANLQGAILGLLRDASDDYEPDMVPDCIVITAESDPLIGVQIDVEYRKGTMPISGESL